MGIFDLFSKRQTDAMRAAEADVYQYEEVPQHLRVQVHQIALDALGRFGDPGGYAQFEECNDYWEKIEKVYKREKGVMSLGHEDFAGERISRFMMNCRTEAWLDLLELMSISIMAMSKIESTGMRRKWGVVCTGQEAIDEINYRMRQAGLGFQLESCQLI